MHPFFICDQDKIESKLKGLIKTRTCDDGWSTYYIDCKTNENWLLTQYHSESQGGGISVLKKLPELSMHKLIDIAITSMDLSDITGASIELLEREKLGHEDFRAMLLNKLLQMDVSQLTDFEKERLRIIIYESELYDSTNRRKIVAKHFTEIKNDADYYKAIAQKAKEILTGIE